jgi:hypothetical protein
LQANTAELSSKASYRTCGGASVQFIEIDRDAAVKLDSVLHDALEQM